MILADTGFWLALANRRDRNHEAATEALETIEERLVTTWPVLTETCHLLTTRVGPEAGIRFIRSGRSCAYDVFALEAAHFPRLEALMAKYRDLPMDLADASLVILAEELGSGRILSTDQREFRTYRWKNRKPFRNLLLA